jgi:PAS domain S-box-containing protein
MNEAERVLYVDGDRTERERVSERLRAAGYEVVTATDADQAIEVLRDRGVDAVVSEYRLPDGDGLDLFDRIYSGGPGTVFVLFTAHGSETLAGEVVTAGVDGYVPKREGLETLVERVDRALLLRDRGVVDDGSSPETTASDRPDHERIFESLGDAVYALDEDGYFTSVNGRLVSASGYTRTELVGSHVGRLIPADELEAANERVERLLAEGGSDATTFEVHLEDTDGRLVPCEVSVSVLTEAGEFAGTVGIVREIAERKHMERRLRQQKHRIESLHRTASRLGECRTAAEVYSATVEAAERVLNLDGSAIHVVDPGGSHLVPHTWTGEDDPRTYTALWPLETSIQGEAIREEESRRIDDCDGGGPDLGPYRSLLAVPLRERELFQAVSTEPGAFSDADVEVAEILLAHAADALERVDFEGELRAERDRFAALFENVPDSVVDADHDETGAPVVQAVNPAFERTFGVDADAVVGKRLGEIIVPQTDDAREEAREINEQVRDGTPVEREVQRRTADGLRTFLLTMVPVDVEAGRRFALYTDVTERKQRRRRLEVLNRVLRHDLRNNMSVIQTATEALADHADDDGREYIDIVEASAEELVSLVEKTRTIERTIDSDDYAAGPVDAAESARRVVENVREDHPEAEIDVSAPSRALVGSDGYLDQALENVVENAVEHNDTETPRVSVTVDPDGDDETVAIRVTDDGPGIPETERELVVEDREITQLRHASGMGLWLVNWLVTRTGGDLDIADAEPRGSVVTLKLPRIDAEGGAERPVTTEPGDEK